MRCILSKFYIKPQRRAVLNCVAQSCILSKFYIKPQQIRLLPNIIWRCILSKFYIKPQLARQWLMVPCVVSYRNSTSNHNAVAYEPCFNELYLIEILHQTTTGHAIEYKPHWLYLIEILHQTTTLVPTLTRLCRCILSKFYIKPQLVESARIACVGCILSKFYIKPQRPAGQFSNAIVVSYRNSTSNHNFQTQWVNADSVVSYRNSTSNHNPWRWR